jgi:glycosyltransferase involved in cell wall biosynthesis
MQKVSIVIPTFNSSKYLKATLDSVLSQTYTNWECILVDDGSIDLTGTISVNYQEKDNRFQLYKRPVDLPKGPSSARNYGVSKAKGDYLIFLDADDFYLENRFENDIKLFESDSSIDGVYNAIGVHFYRNATDGGNRVFPKNNGKAS